MPRIWDSNTKNLLPDHRLNSSDVIGNTRYALQPVFPDGVPYKYLKTVAGQVGLIDGRTVDTGIVTEMDQAEKDVVDAGDLDVAKTARRRALKVEAMAYFTTRYEAEDMEWFRDLFMEAVATGKTNRRAYIQTWLEWRAGAIDHAKDKVVAVSAATTVVEVNAIVLNTIAMDAADPGITLAAVLTYID